MRNMLAKSQKICAFCLAVVLVVSTVLGYPGLALTADAADGNEYVEIPVPNGDFESGETAWAFEGEVSDLDYYWRIFTNEYDKQNTTNMYEVCSKSGTSVMKSYKISQTISGLETGTYKATIDAAGGNDPGSYSSTFSAGGVSVSLTPAKWAEWITYETGTFSVTDGSVTIELSSTVTGNYLNMDNVKLYKLDDTPKEVQSVQPVSVKVKQGGAFQAPAQATVVYTDGSKSKADVTWDAEELAAVDTSVAAGYTVHGTVSIDGNDYEAILNVTVVSPEDSIQNIPEDAQGSIDFDENWQFYLATREPQVNGNFATGGLKDAGEYTTDQIIDPAFNDADWRTVDVPHDFSIEGEKTGKATDAQAYLQGGLAYYRKTFTVPSNMEQKKKITIDFEGVYQNSVVYLNGKEIGNYPNGYTGFAYDITDSLKYGAENVLVVKVQNMSPSGRWYTGSGIVRPVHLTVDNPARFTRNGITLTSPELEQTYQEYQTAVLKVSAEGYSDAGNANVYLRTVVTDAEGKTVADETTDVVAINPSTAFELTDDDIEIAEVQLWYPWNLGTPYLYKVKTELYQQDNGGAAEYRLVDSEETEYGFRWAEVAETTADANSGGLYVNGVYTKIQGVDLHHDSGSLGAASYTDAYERQFGILKEMGVNAYRTSHCPPSKQAIEVCRRMGILVVEEAFDGWGSAKSTYDFGNFFMQEVPSDWAGLKANGMKAVPDPGIAYNGAKYTWSDWVTQEMVNRDKNEPSIIAWSIGNEIRGVGGKPGWYDPSKYDVLGVSPSGINEYTEAVRLLADVDAADGTRYVLMGGDQERSVPGANSTWGLVNQVLDGYGLNYNTAASVDGLMNRFSIGDGSLNAKGSKTFFFESESSSQTSSRGVYLDADILNSGINQTPGSRGGSSYDNDFASWTMSNEYGLKKDRDRKSFVGQFIWTGFDYLGEPTPYGVFPVGVASFGTVDTAGFPKDSFYLYQSQWIKDPMVHLLPTDWDQWREGEEVDVWVNTNVQTAELFLNGKSLGKKSFDEKTTAYGKDYYETSEAIADDKTWKDDANPGGYTSKGAAVDEGSTNYGRLHLSWKVPYEPGTLAVKAYGADGQVVAEDSVTTSGTPYTIQAKADKTVLKADGTSLSYVECTVVDQDGNMVADAGNLVRFDVEGAAKIVGVDNGQQESTELYKYGNVDRSEHSERTAYNGKVLVILQSEKEAGDVTLTISADDLKPVQTALAVTEDGTGEEPVQPQTEQEFVSIDPVDITIPEGVEVRLPGTVRVHYNGGSAGSYSLMKEVVWEKTVTGAASVEGTVEGLQTKASAVITGDQDMEADTDLAQNTALGTGNNTFSFDGLPEDSPIRNGALATASFTGSVKNYPNNMLNGSADASWTNAYSRGASVLLPAYSSSRRSEYVEFFWDEAKVLNQVELSFVKSTKCAIPSVLEVQYWDGAQWVKTENQVTLEAAETKKPTSMRFQTVYTDRVRVYMENGTPYTAKGNVEITEASVMLSTQVPAAQLQLAGDKTQLLPGMELNVSGSFLNLPGENKIKTVGFAVDYDSSVFEEPAVTLAEGVAGELSGKDEDGKYTVTYTNESGLSADTDTFMNIRLKAKADAVSGTYTVRLSELSAQDTAGEEVIMASTAVSVKVIGEGDVYLSDLEWTEATSGWESVEKDKYCNGAASGSISLKVNGEKQEFAKGLGVCADSTILYDISDLSMNVAEGKSLHFQAYVGIDYFKTDLGVNGDGVYFRVYGDNKLLYESGLLDTYSEAEFVDVDVTGVTELKLFVDKNKGNGHDNADWADAKLAIQKGAEVEEIILSDDSLDLYTGETKAISAVVRPEEAARNVTWTSSDESVVSVNGSEAEGLYVGTLTAKKSGTAVITAAAGGKTKTCTVTVSKAEVTGVTLNANEHTLNIGESYTLTAEVAPSYAEDREAAWGSSNITVASVDQSGKVTALKAGMTAITAVTSNGKSASCVILVKDASDTEKPVTAVELKPSEKEMKTGESFTLEAKAVPADTTQSRELSFKSSDKKVATVDSDGTVAALSAGTVTITVSAAANSSISAKCRVTVKKDGGQEKPEKPIESVEISRNEAELQIGESFSLDARVMPEDTTQSRALKFTSSNKKAVLVDSEGNVVAVGEGESTITVSAAAEEAVSQTCKVLVKKARERLITSIILPASEITLKVSESFQTAAQVLPADTTQNKTVVYLSGNDQVAKVDPSGRIQAVGEGMTTVTAVTLVNAAVKAECRVKVAPVTTVVPVQSLSMQSSDVTLAIGKKLTRKAAAAPANASQKTIAYTSGNPGVATVDQNGQVKAKAAGYTKITASCGGRQASYDVYVKPGKARITSLVSKKKKTALVKWKKVSGASGYLVQVSVKNKKSGFYKAIDIKKGSTVKYTLKKRLKPGKKAYVKVQAYYKRGSKIIKGTFSTVKTVTVKG